MLVLGRKRNEGVRIPLSIETLEALFDQLERSDSDEITLSVNVQRLTSRRVTLSFDAPRCIDILRNELD